MCGSGGCGKSSLGYEPNLLTDQLSCQAREACVFLADIVRTHRSPARPLAYLAGGDCGKGHREWTRRTQSGAGAGGRSRHSGGLDAAVFSVGSDGTDGPTDAAGGYADGDTLVALRAAGLDPFAVLNNNDSYTALKAVGGLLLPARPEQM